MKACPKKYFPQPVAKINFRKMDQWAEKRKEFAPYFDSWQEAHAYMLTRAETALKRARRKVESAKRHLVKVQAMTPPEADGNRRPPEAGCEAPHS